MGKALKNLAKSAVLAAVLLAALLPLVVAFLALFVAAAGVVLCGFTIWKMRGA